MGKREIGLKVIAKDSQTEEAKFTYMYTETHLNSSPNGHIERYMAFKQSLPVP